MILYQNGLLKLDFDPEKSLLEVQWPNFSPYSFQEAEVTLSRLVNTIKNYEVKKLLVYATETNVEIEEEVYRQLIGNFLVKLMESQVKKIARVRTANMEIENKAGRMKPGPEFTIPYQHFNSRQEALAWLNEETN